MTQTDRLREGEVFDADAFYNACYSTTLESKTAALETLLNLTDVDMHAVMDALSDGCGGCNRMAFTTPAGQLAWVSVLGVVERRTCYAYIEVDDDGDVTYVTWVSLGDRRGTAEDCIEEYARVMRLVWEHQEEA